MRTPARITSQYRTAIPGKPKLGLRSAAADTAGTVTRHRRHMANRTAALSKRLSDGGRDETERGEPTHKPNQQLRHAAAFPCCQRRRLIRARSRKSQCKKKSPTSYFRGGARGTN